MHFSRRKRLARSSRLSNQAFRSTKRSTNFLLFSSWFTPTKSALALVISLVSLVVAIGTNYDRLRPHWRVSAVLAQGSGDVEPSLNEVQLIFMNEGTYPVIITSLELHGERADRLPETDTDSFFASPTKFEPFILAPGEVQRLRTAFSYRPSQADLMNKLLDTSGIKTKILINLTSPKIGSSNYYDFFGYDIDTISPSHAEPPVGFTEMGSSFFGDASGSGSYSSSGVALNWSSGKAVLLLDKRGWFFGL
jgi:hypothetical protein